MPKGGYLGGRRRMRLLGEVANHAILRSLVGASGRPMYRRKATLTYRSIHGEVGTSSGGSLTSSRGILKTPLFIASLRLGPSATRAT